MFRTAVGIRQVAGEHLALNRVVEPERVSGIRCRPHNQLEPLAVFLRRRLDALDLYSLRPTRFTRVSRIRRAGILHRLDRVTVRCAGSADNVDRADETLEVPRHLNSLL